ncbi:MAG: hypothetical protein JXA96_00360 [Sedimentisphaerales bacterium]|nr:hypothetical protein [Sedimentisphaerales bacterium]
MKPMILNQNRIKQTLEHKQIRARELKIYTSAKLCIFVFCSFVLFFFSGCNSGNEYAKLKTQIKNLNKENTQLTKQVEQISDENKQLKSQISVLQELPENVKGENLYQLVNVKIHNYSTLYDENKDEKLDTLIVRIQPIDNYGDVIKAAGSIEVELWNLNKPEGQAQIGTWQVNPEELKKTWNSTLIKNFRLKFDISEKIEKFEEPLTLKIIFTDYLTGKIFREQKVIKP